MPLNKRWPSSRTVICHCKSPLREWRLASSAGPRSMPRLLSAARAACTSGVLATKCTKRGARATAACSASLSMSNQRFCAVDTDRAASELIAIISQYANGLAGVAILNKRLCVPNSLCSPPKPGVMPSAASHHATPCSRLLATMTRWSI